jgi:hypothetical protein
MLHSIVWLKEHLQKNRRTEYAEAARKARIRTERSGRPRFDVVIADSAAWRDLAREKRPDAIVIAHADTGTAAHAAPALPGYEAPIVVRRTSFRDGPTLAVFFRAAEG